MAPRLVGLKRLIARVIQSEPVGNLIGCLYGNVIPFHGISIDVRETEIPAANKAALRLGMYESAEYRFIKRFLRADLPVIELGSSIGAISSVIARQLASGQRLTCVEANPSLIPVLRRNMDRNAAHLNVEIVHAAVAYDGDFIGFGVASNNLTSSVSAGSGAQAAVVPGITLSALVAREPRSPYQLVADIEGAEVDLLLKDGESLRLCERMVMELHQIECKGQMYTPADIQSLLENAGFRAVAQYGTVVACRRLDAITTGGMP